MFLVQALKSSLSPTPDAPAGGLPTPSKKVPSKRAQTVGKCGREGVGGGVLPPAARGLGGFICDGSLSLFLVVACVACIESPRQSSSARDKLLCRNDALQSSAVSVFCSTATVVGDVSRRLVRAFEFSSFRWVAGLAGEGSRIRQSDCVACRPKHP